MDSKLLNLPKRIDAERALLSALLIQPSLIAKVGDMLEVDDFYELRSQQIWRGMVSLYKKDIKIDLITLSNEIKKFEKDSTIKISDIIDSTNTYVGSSNIKKFAEEIKNASLLREIIATVHHFKNKAQSDDAESKEILAKLEGALLEINEKTKDDRPVDPEGILKEIALDIKNAKEHNWQGFKTGFDEIDDRTGGLIPTHVWILGAYTGTGKTFFVLQMIINILKQKAKVALFSTEMDRKMNVMRLLGNLAGIGTIRMLKGNLTQQEKTKLTEAKKKLEKYKDTLEVFDAVYAVEDIRLKAKKMKLQKGLDVIFVDFIQNLKGPESIYERMSQAAIELQQLSQELKITVVLVSQVSQSGAGWKSREVIEYKGAGEIAAVADVGLWITKHEDSDELRWVYLRKVRHGAPGKFAVRVLFPSGRVLPMDMEAKNEPTDKGGQLNLDKL